MYIFSYWHEHLWEIDHEQTMSTSNGKTFIKRDLNKFFKNDVKQQREVKPLGKASLHKLFHSFTIWAKYEACKVLLVLQAWKVRQQPVDWPRCVRGQIVKSCVIRDIYINVAVNSFVRENKILDFSLVSKRQHIQGIAVSPHMTSGLGSNLNLHTSGKVLAYNSPVWILNIWMQQFNKSELYFYSPEPSLVISFSWKW